MIPIPLCVYLSKIEFELCRGLVRGGGGWGLRQKARRYERQIVICGSYLMWKPEIGRDFCDLSHGKNFHKRETRAGGPRNISFLRVGRVVFAPEIRNSLVESARFLLTVVQGGMGDDDWGEGDQ